MNDPFVIHHENHLIAVLMAEGMTRKQAETRIQAAREIAEAPPRRELRLFGQRLENGFGLTDGVQDDIIL